jgi:hypothetical protein
MTFFPRKPLTQPLRTRYDWAGLLMWLAIAALVARILPGLLAHWKVLP